MQRKRHFRSNTCKRDLSIDKSKEVNIPLAATNNPSAARRFGKKRGYSLYQKVPI